MKSSRTVDRGQYRPTGESSATARLAAMVAYDGTELEEVNYIGGEASIMGSKPEATMSPISRRAARKQRRWGKHLDLIRFSHVPSGC